MMIEGTSDVPNSVMPAVVPVAAALIMYVPVPPVPVPNAVIVVPKGIFVPDTVMPMIIEPDTIDCTVKVVLEEVSAVPENDPINTPRVATSGMLPGPGDQ